MGKIKMPIAVGKTATEGNLVKPVKIKNVNTIYTTSGYTYEGNKISISKGYMHTHVHCSIIQNSQDMEQPTCLLTEKWIQKLWCTYIHY